MKKKTSRNIFVALCTVPSFLLFCIFLLYPMVRGLSMALYSWTGVSANARFIGLRNFRTLVHDPVVFLALLHNLLLMLFLPVLTLGISLFFAVVLTGRRLVEKNIYRVVFFTPNVLSIVVISILWMFIYNPTFGILNSLLDAVGLKGLTRVWLGDGTTALAAVAATMLWASVGYYMVFYLAAIKGIPVELYESSIIDGANAFRQFRSITFPLIWEIVRITIVFFIWDVFNGSFIYVNLMTAGGPDRASEVLSTHMYRQAFANSNFGYASAIGVFIFLITLGFTIISSILTRRETVQY